MLKYLYHKELFAEIPKEITLGISISGCHIHCPGCHSRDLWANSGHDLTNEVVDELLEKHNGITCLLLLGGEHDIDGLISILRNVRGRVKTAWYCGLDEIPEDKREILESLNYVKIGHYDAALGGLSSPTTNQRFYEYNPAWGGTIEGLGESWKDITHCFHTKC